MLSCMKIRPFQPGDFATLAEIYTLSKLDELRFEEEQFELLPLELDYKRHSGLMESRIYVCEIGGVLGYGAVCGDEIRALFVHPLARGKGVGSSLLAYLLSKIELPARLYVAKSNAPAKKLYQRYGFAITREFQTDYNGKPVSANEMVCTAIKG